MRPDALREGVPFGPRSQQGHLPEVGHEYRGGSGGSADKTIEGACSSGCAYASACAIVVALVL